MGYSSTSKAYRVYNKRTMKVMERVNVLIDESSIPVLRKVLRSYPKKYFLLSLRKFKILLIKNLHLQVLPVLPVFWKIL